MGAIRRKQMNCLNESEIVIQNDSFCSDSEQNVISAPNSAYDSSDSDLGYPDETTWQWAAERKQIEQLEWSDNDK
jgi:hypothetical protein